jgi:hypothetical protein
MAYRRRSCVLCLFIRSPVKTFIIVAGIRFFLNNGKQIAPCPFLNPSANLCRIAGRQYTYGDFLFIIPKTIFQYSPKCRLIIKNPQ